MICTMPRHVLGRAATLCAPRSGAGGLLVLQGPTARLRTGKGPGCDRPFDRPYGFFGVNGRQGRRPLRLRSSLLQVLQDLATRDETGTTLLIHPAGGQPSRAEERLEVLAELVALSGQIDLAAGAVPVSAPIA